MTHETKAGLLVSCSFICLVGGVVYLKLTRGDGLTFIPKAEQAAELPGWETQQSASAASKTDPAKKDQPTTAVAPPPEPLKLDRSLIQRVNGTLVSDPPVTPKPVEPAPVTSPLGGGPAAPPPVSPKPETPAGIRDNVAPHVPPRAPETVAADDPFAAEKALPPPPAPRSVAANPLGTAPANPEATPPNHTPAPATDGSPLGAGSRNPLSELPPPSVSHEPPPPVVPDPPLSPPAGGSPLGGGAPVVSPPIPPTHSENMPPTTGSPNTTPSPLPGSGNPLTPATSPTPPAPEVNPVTPPASGNPLGGNPLPENRTLGGNPNVPAPDPVPPSTPPGGGVILSPPRPPNGSGNPAPPGVMPPDARITRPPDADDAVTPSARTALPAGGPFVQGTPSPSGTVPPLGSPPPVASPAIPLPVPVTGRAPGVVRTPTASGPIVESFDEETHVSKPNETFASISVEKYHSDKYGQALLMFNRSHPLAANGIRNEPPTLQAGQPVYIPPLEILEKRYPVLIAGGLPTGAPAPAATVPPVPNATVPATTARSSPAGERQYVVQAASETFYEIAKRELGDGFRWSDVWRLNQSFASNATLPAGTVVRLPTP